MISFSLITVFLSGSWTSVTTFRLWLVSFFHFEKHFSPYSIHFTFEREHCSLPSRFVKAVKVLLQTNLFSEFRLNPESQGFCKFACLRILFLMVCCINTLYIYIPFTQLLSDFAPKKINLRFNFQGFGFIRVSFHLMF